MENRIFVNHIMMLTAYLEAMLQIDVRLRRETSRFSVSFTGRTLVR